MNSVEKFKNNIEIFEDAYYGKCKIENIPIKNPVDEGAEKFVMTFKNKGEINEIVVAWKAGRLEKKSDGYYPQINNNNYLNGYGKEINKNKLELYLKWVKDEWIKCCDMNCFSDIYKKLSDKEMVPTNFGAVYIINLIFFLSKGELPIYDKYAHKAVKAIYMKKKPSEVYVGEAPDKNSVSDVINMYEEYRWLLTKVFGKSNIDRTTDRALWVYGHSNDKYSL